MSDLRVRTINEEDLGTVIADDVEFDGSIVFEHPVLIRGKIKGSIASANDVFISEGAVVEADIEAHRVSIKGSVISDIKASERIELFQSARVRGSIESPELIVQSGAKFNGPCAMPVHSESEDETIA